MTAWGKIVRWFERATRGEVPPIPAIPPPLPPGHYERPYVPRTTPEEQRRAEEALRVLESYVNAQKPRGRDDRDR